MARLYDLDEPITRDQLAEAEVRDQLENLQGNILHGHGRDHSVYVFLCFKPDKRAEVRQWITALAERITSTHRQLDEAEQYRRYGIPGRLFMSFLLSASGYAYLGLATPARYGRPPFDSMQYARLRLNDPPIADWEPGYQQDIHALVLLADDDESFLLRQVRTLLDSVTRHADIRAIEHGHVMRNAQGNTVEHFGYVDGRSQPLFFERDVEREKHQRGGTSLWDPSAGPHLVLAQDPYGKDGYYSGSYLVFRKLEQNVRRFKAREHELAQTLSLCGEDAERAGALVVGRFEDGTPLALQRAAGQSAPVSNNFTYEEDPQGLQSPLQAHIRKMNLRRAHGPRIVRRGVTYGRRPQELQDNSDLEELPAAGVGLLFVCYQRNIKAQFENLQSNWANEPRRPRQRPGIDPIIGQPGTMGTGQQRWPGHWGVPGKPLKPFDFHGFVRLKGGEYFFAPSIHFLRHIPS